MNTLEAMRKLKQLESHCIAARAATAHYLTQCEENRIVFLTGFGVRDVRDCHENLEDTYFVRLFAEFEVTLRDYWTQTVRRTKPAVYTLLESLGGRLSMQYDVVQHAHSVRDYRNSIIHGGTAPPVTLAEARSYLCTYLSNLPRLY